MARGGYGLPNISLGPAMPYPSTTGGWPPLKGLMAVSGVTTRKACTTSDTHAVHLCFPGPDPDECADKTWNDCDSNAVCANTKLSFSCRCKSGFTDVGARGRPGRRCRQLLAHECHPGHCINDGVCIRGDAGDFYDMMDMTDDEWIITRLGHTKALQSPPPLRPDAARKAILDF
jgi:hypothetical protein